MHRITLSQREPFGIPFAVAYAAMRQRLQGKIAVLMCNSSLFSGGRLCLRAAIVSKRAQGFDMASRPLPSREMVEGPARAPSRAMLHAAGFDDEALNRPLVAVVHSWSNVTPCNMHLRELAEHARRGIEEAG